MDNNQIQWLSLGAAVASALVLSHNVIVSNRVNNNNEKISQLTQKLEDTSKELSELKKNPNTKGSKTIVFASPEFTDTADQIVKTGGADFIRGEISWKTFEDGFPNIHIQNVEQVKNNHVILLMSCLNRKMFLSQLAVMYAFPRYLARSCLYIVPWFGTATMERVDTEGTIATAQTLSRLFSGIPSTESGPVKVMIYDIHTLQNRFYFHDSVIPVLVSAIPVFIEKILIPESAKSAKKFVIVFPDDGAQKRFGSKFSKWDQVICAKVRGENDTRNIVVKEGVEFCTAENHLLIIDDLVQSGGTLIEAKNALVSKGAVTVSCYITHGIFPNSSWKKIRDEKAFEKVWLTNTCPTTASEVKGQAPFEVLDLTEDLVKNILRYQ